MKRLYAFLVGINTYPAPVSSLNGCLSDIDKVEGFLRDHFSEAFEVFIHRLANEEATHANIIKGFRQHLCLASEDDVVYFQFSGHGSEEPTAEAFLPLEPNGKDQTLVCYDSRPNGLHLADKELAVLLHEVATQYPDEVASGQAGSKTAPPHIVVSLDCCHSGSGTRDLGEDPMLKTRNVPARTGDPRPLASYLDGYYAGQGEGLRVPPARHVLFSACESVQKAGDTPFGGVFTKGLMHALTKSKGEINYADLFVRTRASIRRFAQNQNPQFETLGNFNPYTRFLDGSALGDPETYEINHDDEDGWYIQCGAIQGLPTGADEPIEVEIRTLPPEKTVMAQATITRVGAQRSPLRLAEGAVLEPKKTYQGVLHHLPTPPRYVWIHGDEAGVALLKEHWDRSKNVLFVETSDGDVVPDLEVEARDETYFIRDPESGRLLHQEHGYETKTVQLTIQDLGRIARWERTVALENPKSEIADWFDFELEVLEIKDRKPVSLDRYTGTEITVYASRENTFRPRGMKTDLMAFQPVVRVKDAPQTLYFYPLLLNSDYSISHGNPQDPMEPEVIYRPEEHEPGTEVIFPLRKNKNPLYWGLDEDEQEAALYFKLLATTEELDYQQLLQQGLSGDRADFVPVFSLEKVFDEWDSRTLKVTMVRQVDEIRSDNEVSLADGKIRIRPHDDVRAKVSLGSTQAGTRSADPAHHFTRFDGSAFQMMNFSSHRDLGAQNVVALSNLEIDDTADLETNPLEIVLPEPASDNEMVIPIAFDGHNFVVIGDSSVEDGETVVKIRDLPEVRPTLTEDGRVVTPFGEEPQDRSLFKALKMAFFKVMLDHESHQINTLCWVDFKEDDPIERCKEGVAEKVATADTVLLVIHGLIGDTQGMAEATALACDAEGRSLKDRFDLVLTYDYETLNTSIEETALALKQSLGAAGLKENDGKSLTILAHAMGGLVARWFIEQLGGHHTVDHLILAGTPNGGVKVATIEQYRKYASTALNVAINFIASLIPFAGTVLNVLQGLDEVTVTMGQMRPGSSLLETLNTSDDPGLPYTLLAGDITAYEAQGGGFKRLLEKVGVGVGNWVYDDEPNDITASMQSIFTVDDTRQPTPRKVPVVCHHLNYFCSEAGLQALGAVPMIHAVTPTGAG